MNLNFTKLFIQYKTNIINIIGKLNEFKEVKIKTLIYIHQYVNFNNNNIRKKSFRNIPINRNLNIIDLTNLLDNILINLNFK